LLFRGEGRDDTESFRHAPDVRPTLSGAATGHPTGRENRRRDVASDRFSADCLILAEMARGSFVVEESTGAAFLVRTK